MSQKTFSQANEWFKKRVANNEEYIGTKHSFIKLFQHGIVYSFLEIKNKKLKTYFHLPLFLQLLIWKFKSWRKTKKNNIQINQIVMLDPGRVHIDEDGNHVSVYFDKIQKTLDKSKYTTINEDPKHGLPCDYSIQDLEALPFPSGAEFNQLFTEVNDITKRLRKSKHYTQDEKEHILSCFHIFISSYIRYLSIFKERGIKKLFFIRHYHNEGIIAAAEDCGIEAIELQHGLINKHDLYYVYDQELKSKLNNAFFPDRILLFGQYWKDVLSQGTEWNSSQLIIAGDYLSSKAKEHRYLQKENIILVASQKTLHDLFIPRIEELKKSIEAFPEWRIILKLHPFEKETQKYSALSDEKLEIAPLHSNISDYLEIAKIQISIYSTTFFDAIGSDVLNFAWTGEFIGGDYANALIEDGIAKSANNQNIIEYFNTLSAEGIVHLRRDLFYSHFSSEAFDV